MIVCECSTDKILIRKATPLRIMSTRMRWVMLVTANTPIKAVMGSEAPNLAPDTAADIHGPHISVPVRPIRSGIRVVVKTTGTVSGSIGSIPNRIWTLAVSEGRGGSSVVKAAVAPCGSGPSRLTADSSESAGRVQAFF